MVPVSSKASISAFSKTSSPYSLNSSARWAASAACFFASALFWWSLTLGFSIQVRTGPEVSGPAGSTNLLFIGLPLGFPLQHGEVFFHRVDLVLKGRHCSPLAEQGNRDVRIVVADRVVAVNRELRRSVPRLLLRPRLVFGQNRRRRVVLVLAAILSARGPVPGRLMRPDDLVHVLALLNLRPPLAGKVGGIQQLGDGPFGLARKVLLQFTPRASGFLCRPDFHDERLGRLSLPESVFQQTDDGAKILLVAGVPARAEVSESRKLCRFVPSVSRIELVLARFGVKDGNALIKLPMPHKAIGKLRVGRSPVVHANELVKWKKDRLRQMLEQLSWFGRRTFGGFRFSS